jgi:hypothetical protein
MFRKMREVNRRSKEFRELAGGISLTELDADSKRFANATGVSTGEMMEVGIHYLRELDRIDQTSYPDIKKAMARTVTAVHSGELKMLDGKTPINRVADLNDVYSIMGFVSAYRPVAAETIRANG